MTHFRYLLFALLLLVTVSCGPRVVPPAIGPTEAPDEMETAAADVLKNPSIFQLIAADSLEGALDAGHLPDDVRSLFSTQLNETNSQFNLGTISFETWSITRNKIGLSLLEAEPNLTLSPGHQPIDKNKINTWLDAGQADLALDYLQNAGSKIAFLLKGRLTRVNQAYRRGIIPEEEANREKSRIKYAIITLAE
ncbi:MAG: hypothetical protein ACKV1O_20390 [Saprospiraceae bacterium]